jgi:hypothetical protein
LDDHGSALLLKNIFIKKSDVSINSLFHIGLYFQKILFACQLISIIDLNFATFPAVVKTLSDSGGDFKPLSNREKYFLLQAFNPNAPLLVYYRGVI